jgi:cardiolipin synthase
MNRLIDTKKTDTPIKSACRIKDNCRIKTLRTVFWVLTLLGLIFLITLINIIFFPPGNTDNTPLSLTNTTSGSAGSSEFLTTLSHLVNMPISQGESPTVISDKTFLPTLLNAIQNASSSIDFTDYPWANGAFSDQIFSALTNAAKRGVAVRILLDSFGAHTVTQNNISSLEQAGGKVAKYHPFTLADPIQYDERDHMRAFVIDGNTAFIGSVGIVDYWIEDADGFSQWNDFMLEVKNTMAQAVQGAFAGLWCETTGEVLSGPTFYPTVSSADNVHLDNTRSFAQEDSFISIASLPSETTESIRDTFMLTALSAQKKLYIINPFIIPDQGFLTVLEDKARAGVDVRIVSPSNITIAPILRAAWHADYEQLLEAGVKLYEYQPSMIHAKMMTVDDMWSVVGSANIDNRSDNINAENIMGIADPILANQFDTLFMSDLSQSKQITLSDWQAEYGFFSKLYSKIILLLYKQL